MSAFIFKHSTWRPSEFERLAGLSPVALRDLRRRGLAPESEGRALPLISVAQLLLQTALAKHGLGPKSARAFAERHAPEIVAFALNKPTSWANDSAYRCWARSIAKKRMDRFAVFTDAGAEGESRQRLADVEVFNGAAVATVVDLAILGDKLADELAFRPSSAVEVSKGGGEK